MNVFSVYSVKFLLCLQPEGLAAGGSVPGAVCAFKVVFPGCGSGFQEDWLGGNAELGSSDVAGGAPPDHHLILSAGELMGGNALGSTRLAHILLILDPGSSAFPERLKPEVFAWNPGVPSASCHMLSTSGGCFHSSAQSSAQTSSLVSPPHSSFYANEKVNPSSAVGLRNEAS